MCLEVHVSKFVSECVVLLCLSVVLLLLLCFLLE